MVVDTSVLIAVVKREDDAEHWGQMLARYSRLRLSSANYVEAVMVIASRIPTPDLTRFDLFLQDMEIEIEPITKEVALIARNAFLRFGKGRHAARLNYGDCFSYALAMHLNEPLMFKGNDFMQTDVSRPFNASGAMVK